MIDVQTFLGIFVLVGFLIAFGIEWFGGRIKQGVRPGRDFLFTLTGMLSQGIISGAMIGPWQATL
jgi:hypothetical protein